MDFCRMLSPVGGFGAMCSLDKNPSVALASTFGRFVASLKGNKYYFWLL
jgi:hypothetical protein